MVEHLKVLMVEHLKVLISRAPCRVLALGSASPSGTLADRRNQFWYNLANR